MGVRPCALESLGGLNVLDFWKDKRVFVTGHTGFKGTWLCRILVNAGAVVTGYSLEPPTQPSLFSMAGLEGRMTSVIILSVRHMIFCPAGESVLFRLRFYYITEDIGRKSG